MLCKPVGLLGRAALLLPIECGGGATAAQTHARKRYTSPVTRLIPFNRNLSARVCDAYTAPPKRAARVRGAEKKNGGGEKVYYVVITHERSSRARSLSTSNTLCGLSDRLRFLPNSFEPGL